jgi:hypothetical protein
MLISGYKNIASKNAKFCRGSASSPVCPQVGGPPEYRVNKSQFCRGWASSPECPLVCGPPEYGVKNPLICGGCASSPVCPLVCGPPEYRFKNPYFVEAGPLHLYVLRYVDLQPFASKLRTVVILVSIENELVAST